MRSLLIFLVFLTPFYLEANLGALIRGTLKGESKVLSTAAKKSGQALRYSDDLFRLSLMHSSKALSKSKALAKGVRQNVKRFDLERAKDIIDFGSDCASNILDQDVQFDLSNSSNKYLKEIRINPTYKFLYHAVCQKFKVDTLNSFAQMYLLNGGSWNGIQFTIDELYNIYLVYSESFAKEELLKLRNFYKCNVEKNQEIDSYAKRMRIKLPKSTCEEEEGDWVDGLVGLLGLGVLIYIAIGVIKWFK
jgi:hypothetical protein